MKDITKISKSKDVIVSSRVNKECIYYLALFTAALITAIVLLFVGVARENAGLKVYSYVLIPLFAIAALISLRVLVASVNSIFVKDGVLYIKRPLITRRVPIKSIERITVAKFGDEGLTSLKIVFGDKTLKYTLRGVDKEDAAKLKKITKS